MRNLRRMLVVWLVMIALTLSGTAAVFAQESADVALDSPIRTLLLDPSETRVDLDLDLFNYAKQRRIVKLELVGAPEGWDIGIWNAFFDFKISELVVEPTESTPGQRPRMRVRLPDPRPATGDYSFTLVVTDAANPSIEYDRAVFTIGVPDAKPEDAGAVTVRAELPALLGPSDSSYQFEIIIKNDTKKRESFELTADVIDKQGQPVQGWQVGFSPAFGEQKRISSVAVEASVDERVNVDVTPPLFVDPADYIVSVRVRTTDDRFTAQQPLLLRITGKGELVASTSSGLLSMDATAGEKATNTVRFTNFGTAELKGIDLNADAPPQWKIEFELDRIDSIPVNNQIDVNVFVTPPDDAIPGDYEITLRGKSQDATDTVIVRVTVDQSTIWGWLGIVLVLVVLGALMGLFWRLGRR